MVFGASVVMTRDSAGLFREPLCSESFAVGSLPVSSFASSFVSGSEAAVVVVVVVEGGRVATVTGGR